MQLRLVFSLSLPVFVGLGLAPLADAAEPETLAIRSNGDGIDFVVGKTVVAHYHTGAKLAKPYLWPVLGPGGLTLTRSWPMEKAPPGGSTDHVHQKSAWFCHGDVIPEGMELTAAEKSRQAVGIDFWSEEKGHGTIACTHVEGPKVEGKHGQVTTRNEWRTAEGRKVLDETRTLHFHDLGEARLFVFEIDLYASVVPIALGDTKEGSFGVRINDAIREELIVDRKRTKGPGTIENAEEKKGEKNCWGYPSAWCDYSGPIDGKTVGLAILTDPANAYPSCWHSRGYGLMAANPFGREKSGFPAMKGKPELARMAKGEHLKLRFGLLIHPGDAREGKVGEYYERFVKLKG